MAEESHGGDVSAMQGVKDDAAAAGRRVLPSPMDSPPAKRKKLTALGTGTEEITLYDKNIDDPELLETIQRENRSKKSTIQAASIDEFCSFETDVIANAKTFDMRYDENSEEKVTWKILADKEYATDDDDPMIEYPKKASFNVDIDFGEVGSYNDLKDIFFEHFFPDVVGHAQLIDEFHSDPRSPMYTTVQNDSIIFHDPNNKDPDWIVKQCYLIMVAAATESEVGVENLWKRGPTGGRRDYPDFGQYLPRNWFVAFQAAAGYMWSPKKYWYDEKHNKPWDIFVPALDSFNAKRKKLIQVICLMMDESIIGGSPKTSERSRLPSITFEPRKPVPLGTKLRNSVDCVTGILVHQDIVMNVDTENDSLRRETTSLSDNSVMPTHTAEVLRQVEASGVVPGGWVGGDDCFGSVATSVEVFKRFSVHSTFLVVKSNQDFFPLKALHAVLKARHGDRSAGHWVTMTTTISGVPLIALAYGCSQDGVSYFISTCGSTEVSPIKHECQFEDAMGHTFFKLIKRPKLAHFLYECLPLIDEHNKQRQDILALENVWRTEDVWFRNITTLLGQSTVDMHRCFRNRMIEKGVKKAKVDSIKVIKFADLMCGCLKQWPKPKQHIVVFENEGGTRDERLTRIYGKDGETNKPPTKQQEQQGRNIGNAYVRNCFVCRGYLSKKGKQINNQTSFWCSKCHMPLCRADRRKDDEFGPPGSRDLTCVDAHYYADNNSVIFCGNIHGQKEQFPKEKQISLHPRLSNRT
ncbi:transposase IS4 [Nitzschia inconspicua]|uniref:Transposase IS4 n=1 Tax=Nitzschia inconspicua TaxID=303405 RepID=A0A9K3PQU5_9STRA|nr:transposase IS4 [Nitzschia inconspicua]